jgi:zinc finger-containing ubiquitin peptidase 1
MEAASFSCPMCDFTHADSYFLMLHVEEAHTEDSPFIVRDATSSSCADPHSEREAQHEGTDEYVTCPEENCGEEVMLPELNEHLDLHMAQNLAFDGSQTDRGENRGPESRSTERSIGRAFTDSKSARKERPRAENKDYRMNGVRLGVQNSRF